MSNKSKINKLKPPDGWVVYQTKPIWRLRRGLFSNCFDLKKMIMIIPPKWLPKIIREKITNIAIKNEVGRAWNIQGCESIFCIWNKRWTSRFGGKFRTIFFNFAKINLCRKHIDDIARINEE